MGRAAAILAGAPALLRAFATIARDHPDVLDVPEVITLLVHLRVAGRTDTWDDDGTFVDLSSRDIREQLALLPEIHLRVDAPRRPMALDPLASLTRDAWRAVTHYPLGDPYVAPLATAVEQALARAIATAANHYNTH